VHTRYRKVVGDWKDIENIYCENDSSNDNLESGFQKDSWRCSKKQRWNIYRRELYYLEEHKLLRTSLNVRLGKTRKYNA